jgi:two-component system chemotaxis response regulator CheY
MPKILYIDDSSFMRMMVRDQLEGGGFEVEDFMPLSSLEVLEKVRDSAPDLVLSDFSMPHVDGLDVARMARRACATTPVVILTAVHDPAMEALLHTTGVRRVLHKPIGGEELVGALKDLLSILTRKHP